MSKCYDCPRRCGADRERGECGFCSVGAELTVAKVMLHKWEEPCISGHGGAGTVFFSGCNLRCVYCQNCDISRGGTGAAVSQARLEQMIFELISDGAECIEFVTPTHYTSRLAELLSKIKNDIPVPVVWNSGGYESIESLRRLNGLVDIYLPDLKYFSPELSKNYSAAPDYFSVAIGAIREMVRQVGKPQFSSSDSPLSPNMMTKGVIVRHLVLPSHRNDSISLMQALSTEIGTKNILLSLMSQYTPDFYRRSADSGLVPNIFPTLRRKLTSFEYDSVAKIATDLGFNGYFQGKSSATSDFTPEF